MPKAFLIPTTAKRPALLARPALVDTAGNSLSMSDSQKERLQLGQSFASVRQITQACTAIHNTRFKAPAVKPNWFDGLNDKLEVLKGHADTWLDDYAIAVTSTIPSSVITFVPMFDASAKVLQNIIQHSSDKLSDDDAAAAHEILARMVAKVDAITRKVGYYARVTKEDGTGKEITSGVLIDWQKDMRSARDDLYNGSDSIQKAHTELEKEIAKYQSRITSLQLDIDRYNKFVGLGAGLVGVGSVVGVVGGAFCFAFPWVGGILITVGVGMVIGGAATWGVMQDKINNAYRDIADYKAKIKEDNATILALGSLSTAASSCLQSADIAISNLADFAATWLTFGDSLRDTMRALEQGGETAYKDILKMDLGTAQKEWAEVKNYANKLMDTSSEVKVVSAGEAVA